MIEIYVMEVAGWKPALRGMRNPMNSWEKSDSVVYSDGFCTIGENDLSLMRRLFHGGPEHRKYARMIMVYLDITAPLYWWKEFDTYKVGTVVSSCSTMHKIHSKPFSLDDFSHDLLVPVAENMLAKTIETLEGFRQLYLLNPERKIWDQLIQLLPSSYNQTRTVMLSYETVFNILHQRSHHKLLEWRKFCELLSGLPYVWEIMRPLENESR